MYETIVIPLDGSPSAERAIAPGVDLAHRYKAHLLLMQVISWPEAVPHEWHGHGGPPALACAFPREELAVQRAHAKAYLTQVIADRDLVGTATPIVQTGDPARQIRETVHACLRPLIVMTGPSTPRAIAEESLAGRLFAAGDLSILTIPGEKRGHGARIGTAAAREPAVAPESTGVLPV